MMNFGFDTHGTLEASTSTTFQFFYRLYQESLVQHLQPHFHLLRPVVATSNYLLRYWVS
jgi:hypothetical protein